MTARSERVALVTGGSAGLGRGIALSLATEGYRTAFTFRGSGTPATGLLDILGASGLSAFAVEADFAEPETGRRVVEQTLQHFGRLDILVHAVGPMVVRRFERATRAEYDTMLETNLGSAVDCAFAALPGMRAQQFGRLVFFGMNGSSVTQPARGLAFYAAAKAGVVALARSLSLEEARYGITVNVIEPGDFREKHVERHVAHAKPAKNPTGHAGSWEDVAYAVRFLVSDEAGFINGAVLGVNGGLVEAHE